MAGNYHDPIFIHSLFRSGSTYMFNVFRRSPVGYWCYQEPFNEYLLRAKENPEVLLEIGKNTSVYLNHPLLEKPYFYEFYHIASDIARLFRKEFSYDYYFMPTDKNVEDLENYLKVLITKSKGRPVLQCCRSMGRISWICSRLGGSHIFLWRNPWDQWWSYKSDFYFERANFLIINSPYAPLWLQEVRNILGIPTFNSSNLDEEIKFFDSIKLAPLESYILFYAIWCHAMLEAKPRCDIVINIDSLAWQRTYRDKIVDVLESFGINAIDFSDCIIPLGRYSDKETKFFADAERKVHEILLKHGYTKDIIDEIYFLRKEHLVSFTSEKDKYTAVVIHAEHIREYGLRFETGLKTARDKIIELRKSLEKELKAVTEARKRLEEDLEREKKVSSELSSLIEEVRREAEAERARANDLGERLNEAVRSKEELSYQLGVLTEAKRRLEEELEREKKVSSELSSLIEEVRREAEAERARANDLGERLNEAVRSKEELSYQLGVLNEARKRLEEELEREKKVSFELSSLIEEVRIEAEAERARANDLGERLSEAVRGKEELSYQLGVLTEARKRLEEELEREKKASSELSSLIEEVRREAEAERARANELEARCTALEHTVQALYKSWSWRITYPLRLGLDALRAFKRIAFSCLMKIWGIFTYPVKWVLARAIKFVLNRPRLREFLYRQLVRLPWIYWRLYNFAVDKGIVVGGVIAISQHSLEHEIDFIQDLSPRARQIYEDLKRAIENRRKNRSS